MLSALASGFCVVSLLSCHQLPLEQYQIYLLPFILRPNIASEVLHFLPLYEREVRMSWI